MEVLERTYGGAFLVPVEVKLFEKRVLFVEGEISTALASRFATAALYLCLQDKSAPVSVVVNSPGGEIDAGLKICETIASLPAPVEAYCWGRAYSMGAVVFESCPGPRKIVGYSRLMLHQPSYIGSGSQTASEVEALSKDLKEKQKLLLEIVAKRSGMSAKALEKETSSDRYYTGAEAVAAGLADEVVSFADLAGGIANG